MLNALITYKVFLTLKINIEKNYFILSQFVYTQVMYGNYKYQVVIVNLF